MVNDVTYDLIKHLRRAQEEFFEKEGLEGAFWAVDLTVFEMDGEFNEPLKKVIDWDVGYIFKEGRP